MEQPPGEDFGTKLRKATVEHSAASSRHSPWAPCPQPWAGRDVPRGRTGLEQISALPSSWFQAPGAAFGSPAVPQPLHPPRARLSLSTSRGGPRLQNLEFHSGECWKDSLRPNSHEERAYPRQSQHLEQGSIPGWAAPSQTSIQNSAPSSHPDYLSKTPLVIATSPSSSSWEK